MFDFDLVCGDKLFVLLLIGKILVIIIFSGEFGFEFGGINEDVSYLVLYLWILSKYLGVIDIYEIVFEY